MVDFLGRQDPKIRPGFFLCRQNGSVLTIQEVAAQEHYYCIECKPLRGIPCPHQKPCLDLRLREQQAEVLRAEQQKQGNQRRSTVFGEAFRNLHRW